MSTSKKTLQKEFNSNFAKHRPGGYYAPHIKGKGDPGKGKTTYQRKVQKKKPLPGGYPNLGSIG